MIAHTITIEPISRYPGGLNSRCVVERYNGTLISICTSEDCLLGAPSIEVAAARYARMYDAEYEQVS